MLPGKHNVSDATPMSTFRGHINTIESIVFVVTRLSGKFQHPLPLAFWCKAAFKTRNASPNPISHYDIM